MTIPPETPRQRRLRETENGRVQLYTFAGQNVAIAREGTRWFLSVGPSGMVRDAKHMRYVEPPEQAKVALLRNLEFAKRNQ